MSTGPIKLDVTAGDDGGFTVSGPAIGELGQPGASLHVVVEQRAGRVSMLGALRGIPGPTWSEADFESLSEEMWGDTGLIDGQ